jgi:hypothetical protein
MTPTTETLAAELLGAQHPGGAAHLVILAVVVIVALVVFGVKRLRVGRTSAAEHQSDSNQGTRSTEDK